MNKTIKNISSLVILLLLTATPVMAGGTVTIVKQLNGTVDTSAGTVTTSIAQTTNVCTLTVTPATGNYITADYITAVKVIDGGSAQAPGFRAPGISESIVVTATSSTADPSGETKYTFTMPSSEYDVEVVANFQSTKSIADGTLELAIPETGYYYDGEAKEPGVTVIVDDVTLTENTDFTVAYENNVEVGTATVTVTGIQTYTGTLTETFTIGRQLDVTFTDVRTWATYCAAEDLVTPAGLTAYIVTGVEGNNVTAKAIDYIPQGVAVLLNAEEQPEVVYAEAYTGTTQTFSENILQGCAEATAVSSLTAENDIYVLYNDEFVKTVSGTIPAFRCYLPISKSSAAGARLSIIVDGEETTGISSVYSVKNSDLENTYYDLQGRKVMNPAKGFYIVNGKKVVVK